MKLLSMRTLFKPIAASIFLFVATPLCAASDQPALITLSMRINNVFHFSAKDKTYKVDGTLWIAFDGQTKTILAEKRLDAIDLLEFYNLIEPWNSKFAKLNDVSIDKQKGLFSQAYHFQGLFYSDRIDYARFPFGQLVVYVIIQPSLNADFLLGKPLQIEAMPGGGEIGSRAGLSGYELANFQLVDIPYKRASIVMKGDAVTESRVLFEIIYTADVFSAVVFRLLPLIVVMTLLYLMLFVKVRFVVETLALPPVLMLTLVVIMQDYQSLLPSIPYLTLLDKLMAYSMLLIVVVLAWLIWLANNRSEGIADKRIGFVSKYCSLFYALSFFGYAAIILKP